MAIRRGRRIMLGLLAMLATGVFVGCDQPALALDGAEADEPAAAAEQQPTRADEPADRSETPADQPQPTTDQTQEPGVDRRAPDGADHTQNVPSDDEGSNTGETDTQSLDGDDGADTEDGNKDSDDEELDDDKWRIPTRGSGGDSPPDYIAPSDPKTV